MLVDLSLKLQAPSAKLQAPSTKPRPALMMPQLKSKIKIERNNMQTIKTELTKINDELLEFYNRPGMALHFQPSNLKKLKEIIEKLIFLEEVIRKE